MVSNQEFVETLELVAKHCPRLFKACYWSGHPLAEFPPGWLRRILAEADLRAGRRRAIECLLDIEENKA